MSDVTSECASAISPFGTIPETEGYSFGLIARLCGLICFLVINPVLLFMWFDNPKFVDGPVDAPEIIIGIVTLGMLWLGVWGLLINFAKTRVSRAAIEWGVIRKKRLPFECIESVDDLKQLSLLLFPAVTLLRLTTVDSKVIEITGGTGELRTSFVCLQSRYPRANSLQQRDIIK